MGILGVRRFEWGECTAAFAGLREHLGFSALDMPKSTEGLSKPHFCPRMAKELPGVLSAQPQQAPLLALGYSDE